jgi:NTE family protein
MPSYDRVALVLQGGGALGAYQVGVYQALDELGLRPDWVAGISIGAVNGAIIAGNPPEQRVRRLEEFWRSISDPLWWPWPVPTGRGVHDALSAMRTTLLGNPGLFRPRPASPLLAPRGSENALSYYDPAPLRGALERFVDFDRINAAETRLSLGATNVRSGDIRYFDSAREVINLEHVMASSALPPAFPPVEIDGELYWDGAAVSNTPLNAVLDAKPRYDTLCVMVDLFSAEGPLPSGMDEVMARLDEIVYASRTDTSLAHFQEKHDMRRAITALIDELPTEARRSTEVQAMAELGCTTTMTIVRLAYQAHNPQEYDFSRRSMEDRMRAGYDDTISGYSRLKRLATPTPKLRPTGVFIYDLTAESLEREDERRERVGPVVVADVNAAVRQRSRRQTGRRPPRGHAVTRRVAVRSADE